MKVTCISREAEAILQDGSMVTACYGAQYLNGDGNKAEQPRHTHDTALSIRFAIPCTWVVPLVDQRHFNSRHLI